MMQKHCACHKKRLSTHYERCRNVTKCHACHAKQSSATFGTSKSDSFCRTHHRHGPDGCERWRTVADGCERWRTAAQRLANTASTPKPPEWNGNPWCSTFHPFPLFAILAFPLLMQFFKYACIPRRSFVSFSCFCCKPMLELVKPLQLLASCSTCWSLLFLPAVSLQPTAATLNIERM